MNPSDYSTISFPSFGIEWDPPRLFEIGPLDIRLYALCITVGADEGRQDPQRCGRELLYRRSD